MPLTKVYALDDKEGSINSLQLTGPVTDKEIIQDSSNRLTTPDIWGVALGYRIAEIPYTDKEQTVSDIVPLLYYEKGRFFWRGIEAGYQFYQDKQQNISAIGRYRFYDIPARYQNKTRGNAYDFGVRYRRYITDTINIDLELLNDRHGRNNYNIGSSYTYNQGAWYLKPYVNFRWKNSKFNNYYYGLGVDNPGADYDISIGTNARYHLYKNLFLLGRASITFFGSKTYKTSVVDTPNQTEIFIGFGFFNDKTKKTPRYLKSKPYIRIAYGEATPANIGDILQFDRQSDIYQNKMTSFFFGVPVSDTLFDADIPVYFSGGYVWHHSSTVQASTQEYVIAFKGYYTFKTSPKIRIGLAEGLSYVNRITYIEQQEMDEKGYRASNLLNYLDFSIDVDLGSVFNSSAWENVWLGYGIHHRSGIFETSSAFGRIKGGSNYTSFYLQYHW